MKERIVVLGVLAVMLCSCKFTNRSVVDFTEGQNYDPSMFYVVAQRDRDLSKEMPEDCYLPGGVTIEEYTEQGEMSPQTSSTSMTAVIQALFGWSGNAQVVELSGIYQSVENIDASEEKPVMLSGKVIMPANGKFKRYMLVSHYTIGSNAEAPSNCFSLEGIFAQMGYCVIIPDYLGYGITADRIHPYLMMNATAWHVLSMFYAVRNYMESRDIRPEYEDIFMLGYSQGGATTMAVQHIIEEYADELEDHQGYGEIKIRRNFAGGGPYDVKATYDNFVETGNASYPIAVPLVIQGMLAGDTSLKVDINTLLQPRIAENLDEWINSKRYTSAVINKLIGTKKTDKILSEKGMDRSNAEVSELYKALSLNSIINQHWTPKAPVYMLHSIDDETVPFDANASRAKSKWGDNNIQYNFGYYGGHVNTCLRFLYTVKGILENE